MSYIHVLHFNLPNFERSPQVVIRTLPNGRWAHVATDNILQPPLQLGASDCAQTSGVWAEVACTILKSSLFRERPLAQDFSSLSPFPWAGTKTWQQPNCDHSVENHPQRHSRVTRREQPEFLNDSWSRAALLACTTTWWCERDLPIYLI